MSTAGIVGIVIASIVLLLVLIGIGVGLTILASRPTNVTAMEAAQSDPELVATLQSMRVAAQTSDWPTFARYVDLNSIRSSLNSALVSSVSERHASGEMGEFEAAYSAIFGSLILTVATSEPALPIVMEFFKQIHAGTPQSDRPTLRRVSYFTGRDYFVTGGIDSANGMEMYMVFRRDPGIGWRLSGLTRSPPSR